MEAHVRDDSKSVSAPPQFPHKELQDGLQEPEQKSLPVKKVQKLNKELAKHNTQLVKSVDTLKKQKEGLLSDKQKLKSENKTLERELKRVSSRGELRLSKKSSQISFDKIDTEDLVGRVKSLENLLAEKDKKIRNIRDRLQKLNSTLPEAYTMRMSESDVPSNRESTVIQHFPEVVKNRSVLDSNAHEVLDEEDTNSRLQLENLELRNKLTTLERNLEKLQMSQKDATVDSNLKGSSRKKSTGFFKRSKVQSKSLGMKSSEEVDREVPKERELSRSRSPDYFTVSDSFQPSSEITQNDFTVANSLPNFSVAGLSPRTAAKQAHVDVQTLRSCLKLAIEEKNTLDEEKKQLELELSCAREDIAKLQVLADDGKQMPALNKEIGKLKYSLEATTSEKTSLKKCLSELEKECKEFRSKNSLLEKQLSDTKTKKDFEIANLTQKIQKLQDEVSEYDVLLTSKKQLLTPSNTTVTMPSTTAEIRPKSTSEKTQYPSNGQIKTTASHSVAVVNVAKKASQSYHRQNSSSSLSSDEHFDSVSNTRAMFEQKISKTSNKVQNSKQLPRKVSWTEDLRGRKNSASDRKESISHSKSNSVDATPISQSHAHTDSTSTKKTPSVSNNHRDKHIQSLEPATSPVKTTSTNNHRKLVLVGSNEKESAQNSGIIVTKMTANPQSNSSAVNLSSVKTDNSKIQKSTQAVKIQNFTNASVIRSSTQESTLPTVSRQMSDFSTKTPGYICSHGKEDKKDTKVNNFSVATSKVKRTLSTPVRSSTVAQFNSNQVDSVQKIQPSTPPEKVTVTASSSSIQIQRPKQQQQFFVGSGNVETGQNKAEKDSSLKNIPEQVSLDIPKQVNPKSESRTITPITIVNRGPVSIRAQRKNRNERPKTLYAGRAETTNLVNLISQFQQQESSKKGNSSVVGKTASHSTTPVVNGLSMSCQSQSGAGSVTVVSTQSVIPRQSTSRSPRPNSYYGVPTATYV